MTAYLNKLVLLGQNAGMDQSEKVRLTTINIFLLIALFLTTLFVTVFFLMGSPSVLQALIYLPLILLVLGLHARGHLRIARILVSYGFMLIVLTVALLERRTGTEYLLMALGCCSSVVFNRFINVVASFLFACICYITYQWYDSHFPFIPNPTVPYAIAQNAIMILSSSIVLSQSLVFRGLIRNYADKLSRANHETQTINEELQATNEELTAFSENLDLLVRQKSAQLQAYVDAINVSIYSMVTDMAGNLVSVNQQVLIMSGYSESELVGQHYSLLSFSDQTEDESFKERSLHLMEGKAWRGDVQHKSKSGALLWFDCVVIPVRDSG